MFFKKDRNIIAGLEIGSSKIKVAVAEMSADGSMTMLGVGEAPSRGVRKCGITGFETAQKCVEDALADAEESSGVEIYEVSMALNGTHIRSKSVRVSTTIIDAEHDGVKESHISELREHAKKDPMPPGHCMIHELRQHYYLDNGSMVEDPIGISSRHLHAGYHLVSGLENSLHTSLRCVRDLSVEIPHFAVSSYATAQSVLTPEQKQHGAVVINCGAGVTDYIVYKDGAVMHTGVVGVGGDHLTNDVALGFKIPFPKAEKLKIDEGSVILSDGREESIITIPGEYTFSEKKLSRKALVAVLSYRQAEIFDVIVEDLQSQPFWNDFAGSIYLTGGGTRLKGIDSLATEVFGRDVHHAVSLRIDGDEAYCDRADLSTVFGLLHYTHSIEMENMSVRGWRSFGESLKKMLVKIGLFSF